MAKIKEIKRGEIVIYKAAKGPELKVWLEAETVWLTQKQITVLFGTQRPAITKHLNNIFMSGELNKNSVSSILEHTAADGKTYKTQFYNLDVIISVGYRVNSRRATQFRIWATKTLKNYLIKGYAINEKRLLEARENKCQYICVELGHDRPEEPVEAQKRFFERNGFTVWSDKRAQFSGWVGKKELLSTKN